MYKQLLTNILLTFFAISIYSTSTAQKRFGVFGGGGKVSLFKFPFTPEDFDRYSSTTAFWAGINADIPISKSGINLFSSIAYSKKGFGYSLKNEVGSVNTIKDSLYTQKLNFVDINFQIAKKFKFGAEYAEDATNSFFVATGPQASILISGKEDISTVYFGAASPNPTAKPNTNLSIGDSAGSYKRMYFSWGVSAGFEFNRLRVWASAAIPVTYYYQDAKKAIEHKLKSLSINAGYTLFTGVKREKSVKPKPYIPVAADSVKDSDGDGILDINDKCPGHKGIAKYNGCPEPDSDGDGVYDNTDKCPDEAGLESNNGCPAPDAMTVGNGDTTRFIIYFEPAKSTLRAEGYSVLSQVVGMLKANPKLMVLLKGHTDFAGTQEANFKRSLERVTVCSKYIQSYYINKNRILTASYGNTMPAADLLDPLLQWKNRRVEVLVFTKE